jgi:hypothetical protein
MVISARRVTLHALTAYDCMTQRTISRSYEDCRIKVKRKEPFVRAEFLISAYSIYALSGMIA